MRTTRIAAALAAVLVAGGLLAACGGDSKADYAQEVEDVLNPLGEDLSQLGTTVSGATSTEAIAEGVGNAEEDLDQAASDLDGLDVPDGVEQVNADLVAAIQGFSDDLGTGREAAESGDRTELQNATLELPQAASALQEELNRIQQAAIDAGVPIEEPSGG
jgi:hypothetical protein